MLTYGDYNVRIYLGAGDGTFTSTGAAVFTGFDLEGLATADLNGDGKADLVVSEELAGEMPLLGNGDGSFTQVTFAPSYTWSFGTALVADFNGDGRADVAVLNHGGYTSSGEYVLLGGGDGTLTLTGPYAGLVEQQGSVADVNGDGSPDLVYVPEANSVQPVSVLLAQAGLTATATVTGAAPLGTGTHQVEAVYVGDGNFAGSTSATVGLTGSRVTPGLTVSANPATGVYGQQVVLSATLSPYAEPGLSSNGESVSFYSNGSYLGSASLSSGVASLSTTSLGAGTDSVTARYLGDADLAGVTSSAFVFQGSKATPTITWAPAGSAVYTGKAVGSLLNTYSATGGTFAYTATTSAGTVPITTATVLGVGTYTLTAKLTPSDTTDYNTATSSVTYVVTPATLTVVPVNATRVYGTGNPTLSGSVTGALGTDTFSVTPTTAATATSPVGTYAITYTVTGTNLANYSVKSATGTLTVTAAGTSTGLVLSNGNLTLTATVTQATAGTPTGTVSFYAGQTLLGTGTLTGGVASYTATALPAGNVSVSAQYGGDGNFAGSASTATVLVAAAPSAASLTVATSGTATDALNFTVAPGYSGTLQLACTGLPANTVCSFSPSTAVFSGGASSASVTLTVQTGATATAAVQPWGWRGRNAPLFAMMFVPGLLAFGAGRRRGWRGGRMLLVWLLCGLGVVAAGGCGGSSGGGSSGSSSAAASPAPVGTTSFSVVATGANGLTQTTSLSLTVQ